MFINSLIRIFIILLYLTTYLSNFRIEIIWMLIIIIIIANTISRLIIIVVIITIIIIWICFRFNNCINLFFQALKANNNNSNIIQRFSLQWIFHNIINSNSCKWMYILISSAIWKGFVSDSIVNIFIVELIKDPVAAKHYEIKWICNRKLSNFRLSNNNALNSSIFW